MGLDGTRALWAFWKYLYLSVCVPIGFILLFTPSDIKPCISSIDSCFVICFSASELLSEEYQEEIIRRFSGYFPSYQDNLVYLHSQCSTLYLAGQKFACVCPHRLFSIMLLLVLLTYFTCKVEKIKRNACTSHSAFYPLCSTWASWPGVLNKISIKGKYNQPDVSIMFAGFALDILI